jgi:hypothetical protein
MLKKIIYYIKRDLEDRPKLIICIPFFGLVIADLLELELWPRWICWVDVSSFRDSLSLSLSGLVVLFLFYNLLLKKIKHLYCQRFFWISKRN